MQRFGYGLPLGVDGMESTAEQLYAGWPERFYIVDPDGKIAFKGEPGPIGYASLAASDRDRLRALIRPEEPWSRIILVNPLDPHSGFEL